jgi:hypothetical protein
MSRCRKPKASRWRLIEASLAIGWFLAGRFQPRPSGPRLRCSAGPRGDVVPRPRPPFPGSPVGVAGPASSKRQQGSNETPPRWRTVMGLSPAASTDTAAWACRASPIRKLVTGMQGRRKILGALAGSAIALAAVAGPALAVMAGPDCMEMLGAASHPSAAGQAQPDGVFTIGGRPALAADQVHHRPGPHHRRRPVYLSSHANSQSHNDYLEPFVTELDSLAAAVRIQA